MDKVETLGFDNVYVINLERRKDRLIELSKYIPYVKYEIVKAVNGEDVNVTECIDRGLLNNKFYDPNAMLTKGIIGCALSHYNVWKTFLERDDEEKILILEDDVKVEAPLIEKKGSELVYGFYYEPIIREINSIEWDMFYLGKKKLTVPCKNQSKDVSIPIHGKSGYGAHAYAITKKMARILVEEYIPIKYAVDVFIEDKLLENKYKIYSVTESLLRQHSDGKKIKQQDSDTFVNPLIKDQLNGKTIKQLFVEPFVTNIKLPDKEKNEVFYEVTIK